MRVDESASLPWIGPFFLRFFFSDRIGPPVDRNGTQHSVCACGWAFFFLRFFFPPTVDLGWDRGEMFFRELGVDRREAQSVNQDLWFREFGWGGTSVKQ